MPSSSEPHIEAELKFPVECEKLDYIMGKLESLGFRFESSRVEEDFYLFHPCRNVLETREAIRVRRVNGSWESITYKGPPLDSSVKAREEIIVRVSHGNPLLLMERLGFRGAVRVVKRRKYYRSLSGETLVTLDVVEGLGCFVEIEVKGIEKAYDKIKAVADMLGLNSEPLTTSYAELLAEKKRGSR